MDKPFNVVLGTCEGLRNADFKAGPLHTGTAGHMGGFGAEGMWRSFTSCSGGAVRRARFSSRGATSDIACAWGVAGAWRGD